MPGGNTRSVLHYAPYPLTFAKGEGAYLYDADGHKLVDFLGEYTAGIYGHNNPIIQGAIETAVRDGIVLGGPNLMEARLARVIVDRFPALELVRFTNSGTEANLMAIGAARAFTGRPNVAKFEGAYHGIDDPAMISYVPPLGNELGPKNRPHSVLSSRGLAPGTAESVLVLPCNNIPVCKPLLRENADQLAALIIDPLSTAAGLTLPQPEFLRALRAVSYTHLTLPTNREV